VTHLGLNWLVGPRPLARSWGLQDAARCEEEGPVLESARERAEVVGEIAC
jgi:hypothetical protein